MTDEHEPHEPRPRDAAAGEPDGRDAVLAERLAVPPLDELTRRRLVRAALEAGGEPGAAAERATTVPAAHRRRRPPWWAAAAAAAAVAITVAGIVLAGSGGSGGRPTAASAPAARAPSSGAGSGNGTQPAPPSTRLLAPGLQSSVADLGDLGEVGDPATLGRQVAAAEARPAAESTFGSSTAGGTAAGDTQRKSETLPATPTAPACLAALAKAHPDLGPVLATGTGTFRGRPATVVTARTTSGGVVAVVIVDEGCVVKAPVAVGG